MDLFNIVKQQEKPVTIVPKVWYVTREIPKVYTSFKKDISLHAHVLLLLLFFLQKISGWDAANYLLQNSNKSGIKNIYFIANFLPFSPPCFFKKYINLRT